MITLTATALKALSVLLPVLRRSVNDFDVIPFGANVNDDASNLITVLRQNGHIANADTKSVNSIANALLADNWAMAV